MPAVKMQWMEFIAVGLLLCTGGPALGAGGESPALYVTEGGDVTLPCENVLYPNCSSTVWLYNNRPKGDTDELVTHGKIKDPQKHRRLSLLTNCSLHINNVRAEDAGLYTCQQFRFVGAPQYGGDAPVSLSVLTVRKSRSGGAVTLQCLLYSHDGWCPPSVTLRWVSDTDPPGQTDPSPQIHTDRYNSTLRINHPGTETDQTKWRCQLLDKGEVKLTSSPDSPEDNNDHKETTLKRVLPVRLSFFFLALIVPLVTGAAVYTKRKRSIAQRSDCPTSVSFHRRQADE